MASFATNDGGGGGGGGGDGGGAAPTKDRIIIGHGVFTGEQFPLLEGYTVYTLCKTGYPIRTKAVRYY